VEFGIIYSLLQFSRVPLLEPRNEPEGKKARNLTGSTFGIYGRFRSGLKTKQELVDSLNLVQ